MDEEASSRTVPVLSRSSNNNSADSNRLGPQSGVILASGGYDNSIRFWDTKQGICENLIQNSESSHVNALCITPTRDLIASAGFQHIRLYDIQTNSQTNNPLINFEGISKNVSSIGFSHNNSFMYTGGEDCHARIWDIRAKRLACQRQYKVPTPINSVFLHPNEIELYIADQSGSIYIWNLQNDTLQHLPVTKDGFIQHIAYDKNCRLLAAIDTVGKCFIFCNTSYCPKEMIEEKNGEMTASGYLHRRLTFQAHEKRGLKCCFSPDSTLLATASADTTVKFWRTHDLSIVNSHHTVQMDDGPTTVPGGDKVRSPGGAGIKKSLSGSRTAAMGNEFLKYRQFWSVGWSNAEDVGLEFDPTAEAMFGAPFLARLFPWKKLKPQKPPPCYLKRRKRRCTHDHHNDRRTFRSNTSPGFSKTSTPVIRITSSTVPSKSKGISGRDLNVLKHHHPHCVQTYPNFYNHYLDGDRDGPARSSQDLYAENAALERREDEEFLKIIKELNLVDSDFDTDDDEDRGLRPNRAGNEDDDEDDEDEEDYDEDEFCEDEFGGSVKRREIHATSQNGVTESPSIMNRARYYNSGKTRVNFAASECDCSCDCPTGTDGSGANSGGNESPVYNRRMSATDDIDGAKRSRKRHKNEWFLSEQMTPIQILRRPNQKWVWDMAFSADSQWIFTGSSDNYVRLWSVNRGLMEREYTGHQKAVIALALSDDLID